MEKKYVVRPQNDGKILGVKIGKIHLSDEGLNIDYVENINLNLSDGKGFTFNKDSRFEVIIKQIK